MIIEFNEDNKGKLVEDNLSSLIDFWAPWCGPCRMMSKNIEEFSKAHPEVTIIKVNAELYPEIADEWNVLNLPTMILVNPSKEVELRHVGMMTVKDIEEFASELIK